jgi:hypothetical protein
MIKDWNNDLVLDWMMEEVSDDGQSLLMTGKLCFCRCLTVGIPEMEKLETVGTREGKLFCVGLRNSNQIET